MTRSAGEELKAAQGELEGAETMYWAGRLSQAEFYGARSMLVTLEDKSSGLDHRVRAARIALKRWVGEAGEAPLAPPPHIARIRPRPRPPQATPPPPPHAPPLQR